MDFRDHFAMLARHEGHWPSVAFCNHDIMRTVTRFGGRDAPPAVAKLMFAILLSLKGTALIYQGEELGLPQADIRRDQIKDPVGDLYYPYSFGRDGCRQTPDAQRTVCLDLLCAPCLPGLEQHRKGDRLECKTAEDQRCVLHDHCDHHEYMV